MRIKVVFFLLPLIMIGCLGEEDLKIEINSEPIFLNDGWEISSLQAEGVNEAILGTILQDFFSEKELHNSKGLLIAKNGKLILEAYTKDLNDRDKKHNIKSVTKSITSTVVGIAIKQGIIDSNLNRTVYSYIPEKFDSNIEKQNITLQHCLTMTTGLEDPFYSVSSVLPGNAVSTSLGVNLVDSPGTRHFYNNGSANIIGGVISKSSQVSFEAFTKTNLLNILGITDYHWVRHSDNSVNPAFDLYLYPRDVLKWGQFCLQNGSWNGNQILPVSWIEESTTYYEDGFDGKFGYHWWINDEYNCYYANGHGGQRVWIIPEKNLVIVHIAEPSTDQTNLTEINELLGKILMAM